MPSLMWLSRLTNTTHFELHHTKPHSSHQAEMTPHQIVQPHTEATITDEHSSFNSSVTDIQQLHPKPTPMQTPNRPYTIEQSDHSGGLKPEPGAVPPFPWKTLVGICVTIFAGIILIGYFFIQGMTDYFDGTVSSETESEDATKTVEPKPIINSRKASVFKAKDNSASKVDNCGENAMKPTPIMCRQCRS